MSSAGGAKPVGRRRTRRAGSGTSLPKISRSSASDVRDRLGHHQPDAELLMRALQVKCTRWCSAADASPETESVKATLRPWNSDRVSSPAERQMLQFHPESLTLI
jgi:hypothetical protein